MPWGQHEHLCTSSNVGGTRKRFHKKPQPVNQLDSLSLEKSPPQSSWPEEISSSCGADPPDSCKSSKLLVFFCRLSIPWPETTQMIVGPGFEYRWCNNWPSQVSDAWSLYQFSKMNHRKRFKNVVLQFCLEMTKTRKMISCGTNEGLPINSRWRQCLIEMSSVECTTWVRIPPCVDSFIFPEVPHWAAKL